MTCFRDRPLRVPALIALYAILLYGCTTPADSTTGGMTVTPAPQAPQAPVAARVEPAGPMQPVTTIVDARPAALVEGHGVTWGDLRPGLSDAAGAEVLRELILDRELARRTRSAGTGITESDLAAEESQLLATLSDDVDTSLRLLETLRDLRRLGPARYQSLLWRNAALRALVRDRVKITDAAIEQMRDVAFGPKRQVRVITTPGLAQAQYILERVGAGDFFGDLAVEFSSDTSAARGGLLEPIGRQDPSYPAALLRTVWSLPEVGAVSDPVLLDGSYAVVRLEHEIEAITPDAGADTREALTTLVRLNQERVLMDDLAQRIIADAQVTIFDDDLHEAWARFQRTNTPRSAQVR